MNHKKEKIMVKRKSTANAIVPYLMKKTDMALIIPRIMISVTANAGIIVSMDLTSMENNKLIRSNKEILNKLTDRDMMFLNTVNNSTKTFPEGRRVGTDAIVQVCYGDAKDIWDLILLNGIWGKRLPNNTLKFAIAITEDDESISSYQLTDNSVVNELDETWTHYVMLGNSPSGERRNIILVGKDTVDWEKIINNASNGFLSINRGDKDYLHMAKESAKLFQCLAGSKSFGVCKRIAIYSKKFADNKFDGMCWGSSEALANHIKETCNKDIHPGALNGMFIQGRLAQGKYGYITSPSRMIMNKINYIAKRDGTPVQEYSWEEVKNPDIKSKIINKEIPLVIIGDKDAPIDIFMDANTLKSVYDVSIAPEYTVLRVLKGDSQVHFSSTIFAKCAMKNSDLTKKMTKRLFEYDFTGTAQRSLKSEGRVLPLDTFDSDNIFMRDVLVGAFPEYARKDSNVALDLVKNMVETANKKMSNLGISMRGSGKGIVVGPENLSQECILGEFEMYNRHLIKMFADLGIPESEAFVVGFKYPTMDVDEYEIYNLLSLDTIKKRLYKTVRSENLRKNLEHEYFMYQDSIAVMPCSEVFKEKHAGSDFDTDMMQFLMLITDKALDIIKEKHPELAGEMKCYNDLYHILKHDPVIVKIDQ